LSPIVIEENVYVLSGLLNVACFVTYMIQISSVCEVDQLCCSSIILYGVGLIVVGRAIDFRSGTCLPRQLKMTFSS